MVEQRVKPKPKLKKKSKNSKANGIETDFLIKLDTDPANARRKDELEGLDIRNALFKGQKGQAGDRKRK